MMEIPGGFIGYYKILCVLDLNYEIEKCFGNSFIDGDGIFWILLHIIEQ